MGVQTAWIMEDPDDALDFLRRRRKREKWTQADIAEAIGTTQSAVSDWDTGESGINLETFMILSNALGFRVALVPFAYEQEVSN